MREGGFSRLGRGHWTVEVGAEQDEKKGRAGPCVTPWTWTSAITLHACINAGFSALSTRSCPLFRPRAHDTGVMDDTDTVRSSFTTLKCGHHSSLPLPLTTLPSQNSGAYETPQHCHPPHKLRCLIFLPLLRTSKVFVVCRSGQKKRYGVCMM